VTNKSRQPSSEPETFKWLPSATEGLVQKTALKMIEMERMNVNDTAERRSDAINALCNNKQRKNAPKCYM